MDAFLEDRKVLIIEDEEDNRVFIRRILDRILPRVTFIEAANGEEGLDALDREVPDIVLLDLSMPVLDGYAVLDRVRARSELKGLPILVLTSYGHQDVEIDAIDAGANDFLAKPFSGGELGVRVRALLRTGHAMRRLETWVRDLSDRNARLEAILVAELGADRAGELIGSGRTEEAAHDVAPAPGGDRE